MRVNQINASRGLGVGPWRSFFKIAFPMALPALITGISLMCMEVMNELGTFALLNIPSISTGIAENWIIEGNPKSAIGLSLVALLIIFTLIIFEKFSRRKSKRWSENPASKDSQGWELKKNKSSFSNHNIFISSNFFFWNSMFLGSAQYRSNSKRVIYRITYPIIQDHKSRIFYCINNDVILLNNFLSKTTK